jgi:hypothetical protein
MRRFSPKPLLALAIAGLGASLLPSCAENDSMMFIIGVYARKQGACTPVAEDVGSTGDGLAIPIGVYNS